MVNKKLVSKDLQSFSSNDLQTLYSYYNVNSVSDLIPKIYKNRHEIFRPSGPEAPTLIYKKGNLPSFYEALLHNYDISVFKEIVNSPGFDVNYRPGDSSSVTLLMEAVKHDNYKAVKLLIEHHADLNIQDSFRNYTALMLAVTYKHNKMIKLLIDAGTNLNLQDSNGNTALMFAILIDNTEAALWLLEGGTDLTIENNDGNNTALMLMDQKQNIELLLWIIENNIEIPENIQDKNGMPNFMKLKLFELKILKKLMSKNEKELLNCNTLTIKDLEKCIKIAKDMIKYKPEGIKMKKLEEKYEHHPYFTK